MVIKLVLIIRAAERIQRAENFQGLEINFGKLLLVYFTRLPRPRSIGCYEAPWTLKPWGNLPPTLPAAALLITLKIARSTK